MARNDPQTHTINIRNRCGEGPYTHSRRENATGHEAPDCGRAKCRRTTEADSKTGKENNGDIMASAGAVGRESRVGKKRKPAYSEAKQTTLR